MTTNSPSHPSFLQAADALLQQTNAHHLRAALAELTAVYRSPQRPFGPLLTTHAHHLAYLLARSPATYAAAAAVMTEVEACLASFAPQSLLDLGAGPGTAAWAAVVQFPSIKKAALADADEAMIHLGRRLAQAGPPALAQAQWTHAALPAGSVKEPADLVVLSYILNELPPEQLPGVIEHAWSAAKSLLVLIEPGSRAGFAVIRAARARLIELGAFLVAPCPHALACPIVDPDWCHFSTRFQRSPRHRAVVAGGMDYDDEKYSYLVASRTASEVTPPEARIIRVPLRRPGHVILDVCTAGRIDRLTISKKQGQLHRAAHKSAWGDPWPPQGPYEPRP